MNHLVYWTGNQRTIGVLAFLLCACMHISVAQNTTQTVRGTVIDTDTRRPLTGATVFIEIEGGTTIGSISDESGHYRLEAVPTGRQVVKCRYPGYAPFLSEPLIVSSAKEVILEIALLESIMESDADEVLITAGEHPSKAANELSVVSTRSFSAEETQRYPGGVNDPGRMALTYPGVQQGKNDSENDIIIRGNSAIGMLWRLEGLDIPNPNHFARPGTSGGGISIVSAQLLGESDFSTGAMPAEYGNAISGAFDLRFRKGNMEERESRIKIGLLGLDFATEGPIKKGRSSYLVNYRYSTLSLLNSMGFHVVGERVDNDFQDLAFNLAFDGKDGKTFVTLFGMGGLSLETYHPFYDPADRADSISNHRELREEGADMFAVGTTITRLLDDKSYLKLMTGFTIQNIYRDHDTLNNENVMFRWNEEKYLDQRWITHLAYQRKFSPRTKLKAGAMTSLIHVDYFRSQYLRTNLPSITDFIPTRSGVAIDGNEVTQTAQIYATLSHKLGSDLTVNAGLHYNRLMLNNTQALEPRLSLKYQASRKTTISFAYGLHSQILPLGIYFFTRNDTLQDGTVEQVMPNFDLDMMRSHHAILSFNQILPGNWRVQLESYYQRHFNIPVMPLDIDYLPEVDSSFFLLNNGQGFPQIDMVSDGTGTNFGVDLAVEKFFSGGFYMLATASWFSSKYTTQTGIQYSTKFDTKWSSTLTLGREKTFQNGNVLLAGFRALFNGGFRYTPPNWERSIEQSRYIADQSQAWSGQVDPYFRVDGRIGYRFNKPKGSYQISLDVQNFTNRKNMHSISWSAETQDLYARRHTTGFIPVLSFQWDF
ncbi:TonB-dependent receptor domain-containing protein [Pontibacter sp. G13]|uniref:TonB-dependent receptor domain-containing protein n=1 Tax=Pontibacter sp. G13 TaxID=3074898 RepID=UPI00288B62DB|nr:TonB-dependent receptor [Pontibacter sp. G13]WNJ20653.1 carboxypeptidase regulatory-like domain-containing protein [Pontibacter sp. G13]